MKIEDVKIGTKVKLISTEHTDVHLGYDVHEMLRVGSVSEVVEFGVEDGDCHNVELSDGYWYAVDDLELYEVPEKLIGNLTLNILVEDREEIAKDILKIVLNDFNKVISDTIEQLDADDNEDEVVEIKQAENVLSQFTNQKMTEIVEQALKEAFKESFLNTLNK